MKENSINKKEVDNGIKINIPIISNQEIENIINTENLYDKIAEQIYHDREMIILQEFIKKLQKENEKLKNKLLDTLEGKKVIEEETPQYIKENYIPIQKVKDKIEKLIKEGRHYNANKIEVLQELLESEE